MKFRTEIQIPASDFKLSHFHRGITIGSCFTTYIGDTLYNAKFPILVNPLGTVYNPVSIAQSLDILTGKRTIEKQDLFFDQGVWQSYLLHSSFSAVTEQEVLHKCNAVQQTFAAQYSPLDYCILSLGTSWVYEYIRTKEIVNNCHKTPALQFTRKRLSVAEIVDVLEQIIADLHHQNPALHIIFTVSPIRHWKDGAYENQISKSALFIAIDDIISRTPNTQYFGAYELLMDDLRDYRYYEQDMLHPNSQAIDYIWNKFSDTYFTKETKELITKITSLRKAIEHRPFNTNSADYSKFIAQHIALCTQLQKEYPWIDLQQEILQLQNNL